MNKHRSYYWLVVIVCLTMGLYGFSSSYAQRIESKENRTATPVKSETVIELEKAVHFLTPSGEDVVVSPGTYTVEAAESGLRLTPSDEGEDKALIIQAEATTHEDSLETSRPLSMRGEADQHAIMLLLPDGKAMQAVGSHRRAGNRNGYFNPSGGLGWMKGLGAGLPQVKSILAVPPDKPRLPPPPGSITPGGALYLKGEKFGASTGTVALQVKVPMGEHFKVTLKGHNQKYFVGSKPGFHKIHLEVKSWKDDKIKVRIPFVIGVPDHPAILQVFNAAGKPSNARKVAFHAIRAGKGLKPREAVTRILCSKEGDRNNCRGNPKGAGGTSGCFAFNKPIRTDKTISAWHVNCDRAADWDEGFDLYTIKLKNGWVIKELKWGGRKALRAIRFIYPRKIIFSIPITRP